MAGIAIAAGIGAAASIGSAVIGSRAASKASKVQAQTAQQGIDAQREMFNKQVELQAPFREAGLTAQNRLLTYLGLPGGEQGADFGLYARPFSMSDFETDPGYAFRMSEGMKGIERSAAARGGLLSGATLKGIQRFGQDTASQEYQNAYNRFYNTRNQMLNPLQAFLGQGQTATNQLSNAAGNLGQGLAAGYGNLGQARASGYVGQANAIGQGVGGISNAVNQYMNYNMMQNMFNPTGVSRSTIGAINAGLPTGIDWSSPASYAGF